MNRSIRYVIALLLVMTAISDCRPDSACCLADYAGWERAARQDMREAIVLSHVSNAEKGNAIQGLADLYARTASNLSDSIAQLLPKRLRRLYLSERQAYESWRKWQETISMDLIGAIWDLWYGGSALASFQVMHIYRIEDQNLEDNLALLGLLCGSSARTEVVEDVTLFQLQDEADRLLREVSNQEYHDRMAQMVSFDLSVLRRWLSAREAFSKSLPRRVRREYDRRTNAWLLLCRSQYARKFCYE